MKTVALTFGLLICFVLADAGTNTAAYPDGYRQWVHVKSTIISSQHSSFAVNGGIHHFYANPKALEGYKTGKFPDGSVLIDDLLEAKDSGGVISEGGRRRLAVMTKDASRFAASGGWDFEIYKGDESSPALNAEGKAACFACHGKQQDRDSTFTLFRK